MQRGLGKGVPATIWAVEPMPSNLAVLRTNLGQLYTHCQVNPWFAVVYSFLCTLHTDQQCLILHAFLQIV